MAKTKMAFALAGLGGFNAHGAGFLTAARAAEAKPDLITATSGQIVVLAAYLSGVADLRAGLIDPAVETDPLAQLKIALFGYQGVFKPAYADTIARIVTPPWLGFGIDYFADRFLPAELYKPARTDDTIDGIVAALNGTSHLAGLFPDGNQVGVVFNSYNPSTGEGRLYGNDEARALLRGRTRLPVQKEQRSADPKLEESDDKIWPIDRDAVKSALWLSLYGFNGIPRGEMDGAYHRSCIVSNLHGFDNVVVCRPLADGYGADQLPQNYFDVQDWNTEMWFSVGY